MDIVVVGSVNWDISLVAPRLPAPGETVIATEHFYGPGGKGANQAVGAARLGAIVAMVGRVGSDRYGEIMIDRLQDEQVDTSGIDVDEGSGTGIAVITIDADGENTIVGSSGANMRLSPAHLRRHADLIADATVVISQLEVPTDTVVAAADLATGTFCLNPAPARPLPPKLLERVDVLTPNRSELGLLAGVSEPKDADEAAAAAGRLDFGGVIVVTLGSEGALVIRDDRATVVPPLPVDVVDPTGAGDAFCAALAVGLSRGESIEVAARWGVAAGALATTRLGAQSALPTREEVGALLAG